MDEGEDRVREVAEKEGLVDKNKGWPYIDPVALGKLRQIALDRAKAWFELMQEIADWKRRYPDVKVQLSGTLGPGDVFDIFGKVERALQEAGHQDVVQEFAREAISDSLSYDHLLLTCCRYVEVF